MNAGLISIVYPFSIFGYALLEETRPRNFFWEVVRKYTTFLLFLKFTCNLSVLSVVLQSETFQYWQGMLKLGIYDYDDFGSLVLYMLPEVLIIVFIMLNEIHLRLTNLYY